MIMAADFLKWLNVFGVAYGITPIDGKVNPGTAGQLAYYATSGSTLSGINIEFVSGATITGTTQTAAINTNYIVGNAAQTTITLPVTAPLYSIIKVTGFGAGGWIIQPGAGQTINTVVGVASTSITSAEANDTIDLICVSANTTWTVQSSSSTGLIIA